MAVQGPDSKEVIQKICDQPVEMEYYHFINAKCAGVDTLLSRTGYTGELGYEIYFKGDESQAETIWNALFESGKDYNIHSCRIGSKRFFEIGNGILSLWQRY